MSVAVNWGFATKKITGKDLVNSLVTESEVDITLYRDLSDTNQPVKQVRIEIFGEAAKIPSFKNSKLPGKNFINPSYLARIRALDRLVSETGIDLAQHRFKDKVFVLVINGIRNREFDADNVLATVRDWLEPSTKQVGRIKKNRGWGIGLVGNDSQVIGLSIQCGDLNTESESTTILITEYFDVSLILKQFISECLNFSSKWTKTVSQLQ